MMETRCDSITGTPLEKTDQAKRGIPAATLSTLEVLRNIKLTTLNNDEGTPLDLATLSPKPLVLIYCSAVFPIDSQN